MIVITGATGKLGSAIVEHLLERLPADQVGVSVTDPAVAASLAERGVRVRRGDFTDPATLPAAFEDAEQVLIVSAAIRGPGASSATGNAIDAAVAAGARRVLYTSHQAASEDSLFGAAVQHAAAEAHLARAAEGGIETTALRNGFYTSTIEYHLPHAAGSGRLALPADGAFSWTAHADLAEAAALALVEPERAGGALGASTVTLTGSQSLDFAAAAALASEITGTRIERVVLSDEEWKADAVAGGLPAPAADFTLGVFRAARQGEFDHVDPTLEQVLGRPTTTVRTILERSLSAA